MAIPAELSQCPGRRPLHPDDTVDSTVSRARWRNSRPRAAMSDPAPATKRHTSLSDAIHHLRSW